jgi:uncharacterized spore protein YtfJ
MNASELIGRAADVVTIKRVFGEPIQQDGITVIPAAVVLGGGGGGGGTDANANEGSGGGFAVHARPIGVYVIKDGDVRFEPALDLTTIITGGQKIALVLLRLILGRRKRRSKKQR